MAVNVLAKRKPDVGLVAGPAPAPVRAPATAPVPGHAVQLDLAAERHCVVCGLPGSALDCSDCKNPVCVDCCETPYARRHVCAHCDAPAVFPDW